MAKRAPRAPAEFVALQVSRLNEALLVAYSAMANQNLEAVGAVRIVRELDCYHGLASPDFASPGFPDAPAPPRRLTRPRPLLALPAQEEAPAPEPAAI